MARPLRIEYPGAFYHVLNRGQRQEAIVVDDRDRERFLLCLERMVERYHVIVHTYCLMTNHYHLILETPEANLSRAVQWLNVSYAAYYNRRHQVSGHVFQGRFKGIVVEADEYLDSLSRYIHLNPVRANLSPHPWEYKWSSCRFFTGPLECPDWLETSRILGNFAGGRKAAQRKYLDYVSQSNPLDPSKDCMGSSLLGSDIFVAWIKATFLSEAQEAGEIPELKNLRPRPGAEEIVEHVGQYYDVPVDRILSRSAKDNQPRNVAMYLCRQLSGQTGKALGEFFGKVSGAAVTMRAKHVEQSILQSRKLKRDLVRLKKIITMDN
jgi:REP element-mobilizing transposase RayT